MKRKVQEDSFFVVVDRWRRRVARGTGNSFGKEWMKVFGWVATNSETLVKGLNGGLSVRMFGREAVDSAYSTNDHPTSEAWWMRRLWWEIEIQIQGLFINLGDNAVADNGNREVQEVD